MHEHRTSSAPRTFAHLAAIVVFGWGAAASADHRDGPLFENTAANGRSDLGELYVLRSPVNANNTVLILTVSPFAGFVTPRTFDESQVYEIRIDTNGDAVEDLAFESTFGAPNAAGEQDVVLRGLPAASFPPDGTLATGRTGRNLAVTGGGTFRAGLHDDPFFFDHSAWDQRVDDGAGTFPRAPGVASNFYGPNALILAIDLEVPSSRLGPNASLIGAWGRVSRAGVQQDRVGRAFVNLGLIPPVPRSNVTFGERRTAFNQASPANDRVDYGAFMVTVLQGFWGRNNADANALANLMLPDVLIFQLGNPNGYGTFVTSGTGQGGFFAGTVLGNGRRLRDDAIDIMLNVSSNGAVPTDNVADDNGARIRDGAFGTAVAFPYIGTDELLADGFE